MDRGVQEAFYTGSEECNAFHSVINRFKLRNLRLEESQLFLKRCPLKSILYLELIAGGLREHFLRHFTGHFLRYLLGHISRRLILGYQ